MPELLEVEQYRQLASRSATGRVVVGLVADDPWVLKGTTDPDALRDGLVGGTFVAARRRGKLLLLDTDVGPTLGLRFGMTGRLVVDGHAGVDALLYAPASAHPRWDRFVVRFDDGGDLRLHDPRRLGGVELDPDEDRLGPDALTVRPAALAAALAGSRAPLKARLLDQRRLAGVGNLIVDEVLWRAGLAPSRPSATLSAVELRRLHRHLRAGLAELGRRGGSHTGDLGPHRRPGGRCPRDGRALCHETVGGRSTWWCPHHQV